MQALERRITTSVAKKLAICVALLLPLPAWSACGSAQAADFIRMRVYSPLVAMEVGASVDVAVATDGCVVARFPSISLRHGVHMFRLAEDELAALRRAVDVDQLAKIDAHSLRATLNAKSLRSRSNVEFRTSDADIVEFELVTAEAAKHGAATTTLRWTALSADRANHPDAPQITIIDQAYGALMELADDPRLGQEMRR